jgi:hypothetical protein
MQERFDLGGELGFRTHRLTVGKSFKPKLLKTI